MLPSVIEASMLEKRLVKTDKLRKPDKRSKVTANTYTTTQEKSSQLGNDEPKNKIGGDYEVMMDSRAEVGTEEYTPMSEQIFSAEGEIYANETDSRYENTGELTCQSSSGDKKVSPITEYYQNINPVMDYKVPNPQRQVSGGAGELYEPMNVERC